MWPAPSGSFYSEDSPIDEVSILKIVWWIDSIALGGAQTWLTLITRELAKKGYEQTIISVNDRVDPRVLEHFLKKDIKFQVIGKTGLLAGYGILRVLFQLKRERFDASVTTLFFSDLIGQVMSSLAGIPLRVSAQQSSNQNFGLVRCFLLRFVLRLSSCVVLNSEKYLEVNRKRYLPDSIPITVIPNAVDVPSPEGDLLILKRRKDHQEFVLGMVGRLAVEKEHEIAIRALTRLKHLNVRLVMTGEGPHGKHLKEVAHKLGVDEQVEFLGHVSDVHDIYKKIDVLLQISKYEGLPTAVLEAMAAGCPVIATAVDGTKELVREGSTGWVVPANDSGALAEVVERIVSEPAEVERRVQNAFGMVSEHYDMSKTAQRWIALIEQSG